MKTYLVIELIGRAGQERNTNPYWIRMIICLNICSSLRSGNSSGEIYEFIYGEVRKWGTIKYFCFA